LHSARVKPPRQTGPRATPFRKARKPPGAGSAKKVDLCALLTSAEIEAVHGESVKETKPSVQPSSSFLMSQCFFRTASFDKSVSLVLFTPDPAKPSVSGPHEYWQKQFHPPEQAQKEKEKDEPAAGQAKARREAKRSARRSCAMDSARNVYVACVGRSKTPSLQGASSAWLERLDDIQ